MSKKRNVQRGLAPAGLFGGATLRDQMAMAALPLAWASEHSTPTHGKEPTYLGVAERSYLLADAMLKARDVAEPPNIKAEPPPTKDMKQPATSRTTDSAIGGWLRRLVRQSD